MMDCMEANDSNSANQPTYSSSNLSKCASLMRLKYTQGRSVSLVFVSYCIYPICFIFLQEEVWWMRSEKESPACVLVLFLLLDMRTSAMEGVYLKILIIITIIIIIISPSSTHPTERLLLLSQQMGPQHYITYYVLLSPTRILSSWNKGTLVLLQALKMLSLLSSPWLWLAYSQLQLQLLFRSESQKSWCRKTLGLILQYRPWKMSFINKVTSPRDFGLLLQRFSVLTYKTCVKKVRLKIVKTSRVRLFQILTNFWNQ
jgi:hypothetical protein